MGTTSTTLRRICTIGTAVAIAAGLSSLSAVPASAAPRQSGATLTITRVGADYRVAITGVYPMTQADAQGYLDNMGARGGMAYFVYGDDSNWDDVLDERTYRGLAGNNTPESALHATPQGLRYHRSWLVNRANLDEDDLPFDRTDEVYATAAFIDGDGRERKAVSNVVVANL